MESVIGEASGVSDGIDSLQQIADRCRSTGGVALIGVAGDAGLSIGFRGETAQAVEYESAGLLAAGGLSVLRYAGQIAEDIVSVLCQKPVWGFFCPQEPLPPAPVSSQTDVRRPTPSYSNWRRLVFSPVGAGPMAIRTSFNE